MDNARQNRWVIASYGLSGGGELPMPLILQGLGRLDCQLIHEDERFLRLPQRERETIEESIRMSDHRTLSYLWVLGAYELVRTIDQRCRDGKFLFSDELKERVREFKHSMERLRIPLAKLESARRYPSDDRIAWPSIHPNHGAAWRVSTATDTHISRRQLSDGLLDLVERIRRYTFSE